MAVIDIRRHHGMTQEEAIATADELAQSLSHDYSLHCSWSGERLEFRRTGAKGWLEVQPSLVVVHLELGLLLRPFKGRIEQEIHRHLEHLTEQKG